MTKAMLIPVMSCSPSSVVYSACIESIDHRTGGGARSMELLES